MLACPPIATESTSTVLRPSDAAYTAVPSVGPPDHWAEVLTHLALDLGFDTFVLMGPPDPRMLRTFIEDVAPQARERVATARTLTWAVEEHRGAA